MLLAGLFRMSIGLGVVEYLMDHYRAAASVFNLNVIQLNVVYLFIKVGEFYAFIDEYSSKAFALISIMYSANVAHVDLCLSNWFDPVVLPICCRQNY